MTPEEFEQLLHAKSQEINAFLGGDILDIVGTEAVNHFKENFEQEGFVDQTKQPWQEVKRRLNSRTRGVDRINKILHKTGELKESISYEKQPGSVIIYSDKPYASAHNEGTSTAGRGRSTKIPKRQFIGQSQKLNEKIQKEIEEGLNRILK